MQTSVSIRLNGEQRTVPATWSVARLLEDLGHEPRTVAVEWNGRILPRDRFAETPLSEDDRIELVRFVQGG
jgi:thiamine biosynthesis protein ThiS